MKKFLALLAVMTASCICIGVAACGGPNEGDKGQTDGTEKVTLTADTDFTALVSDKVTEQEWKAAFDDANYTDFTMHFKAKDAGNGDSTEILYLSSIDDNGRVISVDCTERNGDGSLHYSEVCFLQNDSDGKWYFYEEQNGAWIKTDVTSDFTDYEWYASYSCICPDFGTFYQLFSYDEDLGAYKLAVDSADMPSAIEDGVSSYRSATVKIVNGKLAFVSGAAERSKPFDIFFYDYGTTTVTLPSVRQ